MRRWVFTHSLTGWRHINSTFVVEIASQGAVTLAVEHCDGSACLAVANEATDDAGRKKTLATYVSWERDKPVEVDDFDDVPAAKAAWRRAQCDQRCLEVIAALDGINEALVRHLGVPPSFARSGTDVAVLGQSFGGASAISCVLGPGGSRFSYCLLYDPWLEGNGDAMYPLRFRDFVKPLPTSVRRVVVWRNGRSVLWDLCKDNCEAIAAKCPGSRIHDSPDCGHFAQTDAPIIFESGPLAFVYRAIVGNHSETDAKASLTAATVQTLDALEGWFPPKKKK
ncbi:hypothetical protein CTAYLR_007879 [Chrysophaeum taylorii]|uniref:1-alkyl-2-acetylglycerophosphocholine esterase n=1 Tax=Chrysophaeum taylorii TaxID=2483200 RepID=A0AAD7XPD5_9STRA|nr:hypothetical protein CTAYLR_007879 [Chrysophaeum taylorii]